MNPLINKHCRVYSSNESTLNLSAIEELRSHTPNWQYCASENALCQTFHFKNFYQVMDFINQVADIANAQDHHPDVQLSYQRCVLCFTTHTVNGVTENDFICASLVDQIVEV